MKNFINLLHKIARTLLSFINRIMGKNTLGVRAIVIDSDNKILLVKHTYQPGWYLPGGGVKRGEPLAEAIKREVAEEAGIEVLEEPTLFGVYLKINNGAADYPSLYIIQKFRLFQNTSSEIEAVGWFYPNQLPEETTEATRRRLSEFYEGTPKAQFW